MMQQFLCCAANIVIIFRLFYKKALIQIHLIIFFYCNKILLQMPNVRTQTNKKTARSCG